MAPVKSLHVVRDRHTNHSKGAAYVTFMNSGTLLFTLSPLSAILSCLTAALTVCSDDAHRVLDALGGFRIDDRTVRPTLLLPRGQYGGFAQRREQQQMQQLQQLQQQQQVQQITEVGMW